MSRSPRRAEQQVEVGHRDPSAPPVRCGLTMCASSAASATAGSERWTRCSHRSSRTARRRSSVAVGRRSLEPGARRLHGPARRTESTRSALLLAGSRRWSRGCDLRDADLWIRLPEHRPVAAPTTSSAGHRSGRTARRSVTAAGQLLDPVEAGDARDVEDTVGSGDAEAQPIEQPVPPASTAVPGSRAASSASSSVAARGVGERTHQLAAGLYSAAAAALTASTICG